MASPAWLHLLSIAVLLVGVVCALAITIDEFRHPQKMWIMNLVWPVVALFGFGSQVCPAFAAFWQSLIDAKLQLAMPEPPARQYCPEPLPRAEPLPMP